MHGGAYLASLHRRLPDAVVAGDQKQHPFATSDCHLQRAIDGTPGAVEVHAVKIEGPVGLDAAGTQSAIPTPVEGHSMVWEPRRWDFRRL